MICTLCFTLKCLNSENILVQSVVRHIGLSVTYLLKLYSCIIANTLVSTSSVFDLVFFVTVLLLELIMIRYGTLSLPKSCAHSQTSIKRWRWTKKPHCILYLLIDTRCHRRCFYWCTIYFSVNCHVLITNKWWRWQRWRYQWIGDLWGLIAMWPHDLTRPQTRRLLSSDCWLQKFYGTVCLITRLSAVISSFFWRSWRLIACLSKSALSHAAMQRNSTVAQTTALHAVHYTQTNCDVLRLENDGGSWRSPLFITSRVDGFRAAHLFRIDKERREA